MTFPTHIILGLIVGKVTGNYPLAIAASVAIDLDHLPSYAKNGILVHPKLLWKAMKDRHDPYGDQRGYLHNALIFSVISVALWLTLGYTSLPIIIGWGGHLALDALDHSDYMPFAPFTNWNIQGPILYASLAEVIFGGILFATYFFI